MNKQKKTIPIVDAVENERITESFEQLASGISVLHDTFRHAAVSSINRLLTYRNWLIGMYIIEYEQSGKDRAQYGSNLVPHLAEKLRETGQRGFSIRNLYLFRDFYTTYPQILQLLTAELPGLLTKTGREFTHLLQLPGILQLPTAELQPFDNKHDTPNGLSPNIRLLIRHFSFTHFTELMRISDPLKRTFYEIEGITGNWSVPQLKRQIESLLYERTGMSKNKKGVVDAAHRQNIPATIDDMIRDPYILEFSGLPESHLYSEKELETSLLDHIQNFLLELGNGFCFEARQKRITLDNEHDWIDLVFYHRLLRCHVLIDLKVRKFQHGDAGQMNFYLNYYRENMMAEGDNPPVGLILCTDRNETRVRYASSGMDNTLFVSKYLTALPTEEAIRQFLENDRGRTEMVLRERGVEYGKEQVIKKQVPVHTPE